MSKRNYVAESLGSGFCEKITIKMYHESEESKDELKEKISIWICSGNKAKLIEDPNLIKGLDDLFTDYNTN